MSPYDEFAVETALGTRDEAAGEMVVVTSGDKAFKETLRSALAMGADYGILGDAFEILPRLTAEIRELRSSGDSGSGATP